MEVKKKSTLVISENDEDQDSGSENARTEKDDEHNEEDEEDRRSNDGNQVKVVEEHVHKRSCKYTNHTNSSPKSNVKCK